MVHSVNALGASVASSIALVLLIAAGSSCGFVTVKEDSESGLEGGSFGAFCQGDDFELASDSMWLLPTIFLAASIAVGLICFSIAWILALRADTVKSTGTLWTAISISAAVCALLCVPVFLLYEAEPCSEASCQFSTAAALLMVSLVCWISVTVITQCLDPPKDRQPHRADSGVVRSTGSNSDPVPTLRICGLADHLSQSQQEPPDLKVVEDDGDEELGGTDTETTGSDARVSIGQIEYKRRKFDSARSTAVPLLEPVVEDQATLDSFLESNSALSEASSSLVGPAEVDGSNNAQKMMGLPKNLPALADEASDTLEDLTLGSLAPTVNGEESILDSSVYAQESDKVLHSQDEEEEKPFDEVPEEPPIIAAMKALPTTADLPIIAAPTKKTEVETPPPKPVSKSKVSSAAKKTIADLLGKATSKRRNRKALKGYRLMDDSDIESSYPMTPPLVISFQSDSSLDLSNVDYEDLDAKPGTTPSKQEADLLDDWEDLHQRVPSPIEQDFETEPDGEAKTEAEADRELVPDPETLYLSSDDEESAGDPSLGSMEDSDGIEEEEEAFDEGPGKIHIGGKPPMFKKRRKRKSSRNIRSSRSVASATSLLAHTIEEETAADLEESSHDMSRSDAYDPHSTNMASVPLTRSLSAPNRKAFSRLNKETSSVTGDLNMSGVNSYRTAEIFRSNGGSSVTSMRRIKRFGSEGNEDSPGHHPPPSRPRMLSSSASVPGKMESARSPKKVSIFQAERANRRAMHNSPTYVSDTSSSGDNMSALSMPSMRSRTARQARIRRMMEQTQKEMQVQATRTLSKLGAAHAVVTPPAKKRDTDSDRTPPASGASIRGVVSSVASSANSRSSISVGGDQSNAKSRGSDNSSSAQSKGPGSVGSRSAGAPRARSLSAGRNKAKAVAGRFAAAVLGSDASSGTHSKPDSIDSGLLDLLDVQLAELNRPEDGIGSDEGSL